MPGVVPMHGTVLCTSYLCLVGGFDSNMFHFPSHAGQSSNLTNGLGIHDSFYNCCIFINGLVPCNLPKSNHFKMVKPMVSELTPMTGVGEADR